MNFETEASKTSEYSWIIRYPLGLRIINLWISVSMMYGVVVLHLPYFCYLFSRNSKLPNIVLNKNLKEYRHDDSRVSALYTIPSELRDFPPFPLWVPCWIRKSSSVQHLAKEDEYNDALSADLP